MAGQWILQIGYIYKAKLGFQRALEASRQWNGWSQGRPSTGWKNRTETSKINRIWCKFLFLKLSLQGPSQPTSLSLHGSQTALGMTSGFNVSTLLEEMVKTGRRISQEEGDWLWPRRPGCGLGLPDPPPPESPCRPTTLQPRLQPKF